MRRVTIRAADAAFHVTLTERGVSAIEFATAGAPAGSVWRPARTEETAGEAPAGSVWRPARTEGTAGEAPAGSVWRPARTEGAPADEPLPKLAGRLAAQLEEYLAGRRRAFDVPVDLAGCSPFQREVLEACARIPPGETATYGELARRVGRPGAARAVGTALARNPVPILVPCHRVLRGTGALGGFIAGLEWKRRLLQLEGVSLR